MLVTLRPAFKHDRTSYSALEEMIPLANLGALDYTEREKKEKEEKRGEGPPRGEHRCHSNHKPFVQCLKKRPE